MVYARDRIARRKSRTHARDRATQNAICFLISFHALKNKNRKNGDEIRITCTFGKNILRDAMRFYFLARAIFSPLHAPIPRQEGAENFFHKTVVSNRPARRNRSKSSESVKSDSILAHCAGPKTRRRAPVSDPIHHP
jgi:hypothetical protein